MKKLIDHVQMLFDHEHHHTQIATSQLAEPDTRANLEVHTAPELQVAAAVDMGPARADPRVSSTVVADAITHSLVITGTPGDDTRQGTAANDTMFGLGGNDTLRGLGGNDTLDGGKGGDLLDGGEGFDIVSYASAQPENPFPNVGVRLNLLDPSQNLGEAKGDRFISIEQFHLSRFADIFVGTGVHDSVFGDAGNDTLVGGAGNDILDGGADDDDLDGGAGTDTILGGAGNDIIRIHLNDADPEETIDGGFGFDTVAVDINNTVLNCSLSGMEQLLIRSAGMNVILGRDQLNAFSTLSNQAGSGAAFSITARIADTYSLEGKTINGILTLNGSSGDDTLFGSSGNDTLSGKGGADIIHAGNGNDSIRINANEVFAGEILDGGAGFDKLVVGDNNMHPFRAAITNMEELVLNSGVQNVFLTSVQLAEFESVTHQNGSGAAFSITAETADTYSLAGKTINGILTLNGSSGDDTLIGSSGNDILSGKAGADIIHAGNGDDTILINANEVAAGEILDGGNGVDRLVVGDNNMHPFRATITNMEELFFNGDVQTYFSPPRSWLTSTPLCTSSAARLRTASRRKPRTPTAWRARPSSAA